MKTFEPKQPMGRKRGRPLSFDRESAVQRAMRLFWAHGYEATSLNDLTGALGVTPSSIYAAFGDKKRLFLECVRHYLSGPVTSESIIAQAATARQAAGDLLRAAAVGFTGVDTPRGCLLASSALSCSAMASDVQEELAGLRRQIQAALRDKIRLGIRQGQLPADADAATLAAHTMALIQGMSTLARDGATRPALLRIAEMALTGWPDDATGRAGPGPRRGAPPGPAKPARQKQQKPGAAAA